jgi:hypothetical protein
VRADRFRWGHGKVKRQVGVGEAGDRHRTGRRRPAPHGWGRGRGPPRAERRWPNRGDGSGRGNRGDGCRRCFGGYGCFGSSGSGGRRIHGSGRPHR